MPSSLVTRMVIGLPSRLVSVPSAIGSYQFKTAHVRLQNRRNAHAAVGLLIILQNGDQRAPHGKTGTIERVNIAWGLGIARGPVARLHAPGLEVAADGARGNLAEGVLAGQPHLDVIGHLRGK